MSTVYVESCHGQHERWVGTVRVPANQLTRVQSTFSTRVLHKQGVVAIENRPICARKALSLSLSFDEIHLSQTIFSTPTETSITCSPKLEGPENGTNTHSALETDVCSVFSRLTRSMLSTKPCAHTWPLSPSMMMLMLAFLGAAMASSGTCARPWSANCFVLSFKVGGRLSKTTDEPSGKKKRGWDCCCCCWVVA